MVNEANSVEQCRDKLFSVLLSIVTISNLIYVILFYATGAFTSVAVLALGVLVLSPLNWFLYTKGHKYHARFFLVLSCYFYVFGASLGMGHMIYAEYFYLPSTIISFLLCDLNHKKYVFAGVAIPLILWGATHFMGAGNLPVGFEAKDVPSDLFRIINFIMAFAISLIFLYQFLKLNALLNKSIIEAREHELRLGLALEEKQHQISTFLKNSKNEIFIFDVETYNFTEVSKSALENIGYTEAELSHMYPWDLKPEISKVEFLELMQPLVNGDVEKLEFNTIHKRKNGETYPVEVHLHIDNFAGKRVYQAMILDRTENEKLQGDLIHASRLSSIGELAAGVGHEINNPLTIASLHLKKMEKKFPDLYSENVDFRKSVESITDAHGRIENIVNGLRTYARSDVNQNTCFNASEALDKTLNLIKELYANEGVEITVFGNEEEYCLYGSIGKLQQVFTNLLTNAKDATEGKEKRLVTITLRKQSNKFLMSVKDNGRGISKDEQSKIFNSFYTTKPLGEGTGLGLSITSKLVKDFNGSMHFESTEGRGTTFFIEIPLSTKTINDKDEDAGFVAEASLSSSKPILLVEDEQEIRDIIKDFLEDHGLTVHEAKNGKEALSLAKEIDYALIVTDLKMPIMNGLDFMREVNNLFNSNRPQIIAMSGGVSEEFIPLSNKEIEKLSDSFISKPFQEEALLNKVSELLNNENSNNREKAS